MLSVPSIIIWPVIIFIAFWAITWTSVKKTAEKQPSSGWFLYWILFVMGAILLFVPITVPAFKNIPILTISLIQSSPALQSFGFLIEVLGLCIAIWARITIGRNWSSKVTFKEKHKLVTKGPYTLVRHPIYTGITALFLGIAIYVRTFACFLAILLIFLSFLIKSRQEEKLMLKHFPKEYSNYKKTTKALIPFIY